MKYLRGAAIVTLLSGLALGCGSDDGADTTDAAVADASPPDATVPPDSAPPPDARQPNLTCLGDPLPEVAAATVTISGSAFTVGQSGMSAVEGATIEGFKVIEDDADELLDSDTSSASGAYSLTAATDEEPLDAYVRATHASYLDTYLYPPVPVTEDLTGGAIIMLDAGTPGLLGFLLGYSGDNALGFGIAVVLDCDGQGVHGAVVTTDPPSGNVGYNLGGLPDGSATATDADGVAYLQSVPVEGPVEIKASYGTMELRTVTIQFSPVSEAVYSTAIIP
jgi:hypothetical protein